MPLHIVDPDTEAAVRKLASARGVSLTRAVKIAADEALARDFDEAEETRKAIRKIQDRIASYKRRPDALETHKAFFDWINEEK